VVGRKGELAGARNGERTALWQEKKWRRSSLLAGERSDGGSKDETGGELGGAREGERNRSVGEERSNRGEPLGIVGWRILVPHASYELWGAAYLINPIFPVHAASLIVN
jgi:hypothetical protein